MKFDPQAATNRIRSASGRTARLFFLAAVILLAVEIPLLVKHLRHSYFALDWGFGFYAALGFFGALVLVFAARGLGSLLRRPLESDDTFEGQPLPDDVDEQLR